MYVHGENVIDMDLLRRIADEGILETHNGRYPAAVSALQVAGYLTTSAAGAGYVAWHVSERGLQALENEHPPQHPWTTEGRTLRYDGEGLPQQTLFWFQTGPHFIRDGLVVQWRRDDPGGEWAIVPVKIDQ